MTPMFMSNAARTPECKFFKGEQIPDPQTQGVQNVPKERMWHT